MDDFNELQSKIPTMSDEEKKQAIAVLVEAMGVDAVKAIASAQAVKLTPVEEAHLTETKDLVSKLNAKQAEVNASDKKPYKVQFNNIIDGIKKCATSYSSERKKQMIKDIFKDIKERANTDVMKDIENITGKKQQASFHNQIMIDLGFTSKTEKSSTSNTDVKTWIKPDKYKDENQADKENEPES